jgi:hypothetical protein
MFIVLSGAALTGCIYASAGKSPPGRAVFIAAVNCCSSPAAGSLFISIGGSADTLSDKAVNPSMKALMLA